VVDFLGAKTSELTEKKYRQGHFKTKIPCARKKSSGTKKGAEVSTRKSGPTKRALS